MNLKVVDQNQSRGWLDYIEDVNATGIGYSGVDGVSWAHAGEPYYSLPTSVFERFEQVAHACAAFMMAMRAKADSPEVHARLSHKRPDRVRTVVGKGAARLFRPDVVLTRGVGGFHFQITEFETAPGGLGIMPTTRMAYGMGESSTSILRILREFIGDREFVVVLTKNYVDYLFDFCFACQWLKEQGVPVRIIIDESLDKFEKSAAASMQQRVVDYPEYTEGLPNWDPDVMGRLRKYGFDSFVEGCDDLPDAVSTGTVVFRMAYHGSLTDDNIKKMMSWERKNKAIMLNGLHYGLETKSMMALPRVQAIRDQISRSVVMDPLALLDEHIARTEVLDPDFIDLNWVCDSHKRSMLKVAAWDPEDKLCWGARGLSVGQELSRHDWLATVGSALGQRYPVVVQEVLKSCKRDFREAFNVLGPMTMLGASMRWTPFVLVDHDFKIRIDPGVVTFSSGFAAHGGIGSVIMPVVVEG